MQWAEVIEDPSLQNLPYKIELNRWGNIEMSPASNRHGWLQSRLIVLLSKILPKGEVISECSIQTSIGIRVPDVVWCSADFLQRHGFATPYLEAPEICIEVLSPSKSRGEMDEKTVAYLAAGAHEVWLVDEFLQMEMFDASGNLPESRFDARIATRIAGLHPVSTS
ncbi:Uma2 family endonuclease [uncultured Thiocystis sp.]|jgi:Uma2 family endonuclease|uniref:Uma2 family endonuclease n=1 Tax=uncultured Thiocystis sp. TaxID=1202134 RepID=UPI0025D5C6A8|nr:Uma2 family endonuclease [uncultured Thiocystis sp.]